MDSFREDEIRWVQVQEERYRIHREEEHRKYREERYRRHIEEQNYREVRYGEEQVIDRVSRELRGRRISRRAYLIIRNILDQTYDNYMDAERINERQMMMEQIKFKQMKHQIIYDDYKEPEEFLSEKEVKI